MAMAQDSDDGLTTDDDAFFAKWVREMVRAETSRADFDGMWERIKVKLDDLHKIERLLADVFGADADMVEEGDD